MRWCHKRASRNTHITRAIYTIRFQNTLPVLAGAWYLWSIWIHWVQKAITLLCYVGKRFLKTLLDHPLVVMTVVGSEPNCQQALFGRWFALNLYPPVPNVSETYHVNPLSFRDCTTPDAGPCTDSTDIFLGSQLPQASSLHRPFAPGPRQRLLRARRIRECAENVGLVFLWWFFSKSAINAPVKDFSLDQHNFKKNKLTTLRHFETSHRKNNWFIWCFSTTVANSFYCAWGVTTVSLRHWRASFSPGTGWGSFPEVATPATAEVCEKRSESLHQTAVTTVINYSAEWWWRNFMIAHFCTFCPDPSENSCQL